MYGKPFLKGAWLGHVNRVNFVGHQLSCRLSQVLSI